MTAYAILRHGKVKPGRQLVSVGLHNARLIETPNASSGGIADPVRVLRGTHRPHRDVTDRLRVLGLLDRPLRRNGNVAIELVMAASPDWWEARGWRRGEQLSPAASAVIEEWSAAQLAYLDARFGQDNVVSALIHLDEATPHVQALAVPAVCKIDRRRKDGGETWSLNTEAHLGNPARLKAIQTDYAGRMARFGLSRGEGRPTGTANHKPLAEWHAEQAQLVKEQEGEVDRQKRVTEEAEREAARIRADAERYAEGLRRQADQRAEDERREVERQQEWLRRRADDAAARAKLVDEDAARRLADADACAQEAEADRAAAGEERRQARKEREEVSALRRQLVALKAEIYELLAPIRALAKRFNGEQSPLKRQAMGSLAVEAAGFLRGPTARGVARLLGREGEDVPVPPRRGDRDEGR